MERRDPGHSFDEHAGGAAVRAGEGFQFWLGPRGIAGRGTSALVYVTAHSHSSVEKAALLAGFGRSNLHVVAHDRNYAMSADAFRDTVERDVSSGAIPAAIVATTGTTTTTALDPVGAIVEIARAHGIWVHVDAAMAGSAMILPECRWMWDGVAGPTRWLSTLISGWGQCLIARCITSATRNIWCG